MTYGEFTHVCYIVARCCHDMVSFFHAIFPARKMLRDGIELGVATDRFFADRAASLHWLGHVGTVRATWFHFAAQSHDEKADAIRCYPACNPKVEAGYGKHTGLHWD